MNTKEMTQEQISLFVDGELALKHVDIALAALRQETGRTTWDVYHHISDVLHSDDLPCDISSDFSARFAARLAAEPTIIAPANLRQISIEDRGVDGGNVGRQWAMSIGGRLRRFAIPGMAAVAAAMAGVIFVAAPQLIVAKHESSMPESNVPVLVAGGAQNSTGAAQDIDMKMGAQAGVMLRDSGIDDYLSAHQRFSPSLYRTAQYARSAAFVADSEK